MGAIFVGCLLIPIVMAAVVCLSDWLGSTNSTSKHDSRSKVMIHTITMNKLVMHALTFATDPYFSVTFTVATRHSKSASGNLG